MSREVLLVRDRNQS